MVIIDRLVKQCERPGGVLGRIMVGFMNITDTNLIRWAVSGMSAANHERILDIGCGGGAAVATFSKAFPEADIYGVDYSADAMQLASDKNRAGITAGRVSIRQADVSALPFEESSFHYATAIRTHYFWPDLPQGLCEVYRVLKTGGKLLILSELFKINYHMSHYNTNETLTKLLYDIGFHSVDIMQKKGYIWVTAIK